MAVPQCPTKRLADTLYNGIAISAVIQHENIYGCQFHPEKSGEIGLKIIEQFMKL
jgi:glutamine amidotransferase